MAVVAIGARAPPASSGAMMRPAAIATSAVAAEAPLTTDHIDGTRRARRLAP